MVLQHNSPTFWFALLINLHNSSFSHVASQSLVAQMTVSLVIPCLKIHGITFPTTQLLHPPKRMAIKILLFNNDNINYKRIILASARLILYISYFKIDKIVTVKLPLVSGLWLGIISTSFGSKSVSRGFQRATEKQVIELEGAG